MNSLSNETWDVVIAGTGLPQSLLALSLSRSDLKILHVDGNLYYGGEDAALSLDEAAKWADSNEHSSIEYLDRSQLAPSRSYTLTLNPQIIYAKSRTLPALVSSQIHTQLEFQAVGATYVLKDGQLQKIPSNREDVFADQTLTMRDKRKLMGLLRYVLNEQEEEHEDVVLSDKLRNDFKLSGVLESAVLALALLSTTAADTKFNYTAARLRRHLHSMGYFGPGLAAVMAKYGGNSEIAQVGCRACAVGGGVYLLGHQVVDIQPSPDEGFSQVTLSNGVTVRARYVVASTQDLTFQTLNKISIQPPQTQSIVRSVTIMSHPLKRLFVPVSESATIPAVVAVMVDGGQTDLPPVYLQVHSEDTAECPKNQCVIYASTIGESDSYHRLDSAVDAILQTASELDKATVIWRSHTTKRSLVGHTSTSSDLSSDASKRVWAFPPHRHDIVFDDSVLDNVERVWRTILGPTADEVEFMRFAARAEQDED